MKPYNPALSHFDLDMARGRQAELWIEDIQKALADGSAQIEVKRDSWFPISGRFYIEHECYSRDGIWRPSGISVTKARLWALVFGGHPGGLIIEVEWLKRGLQLARQDKRNAAEMTYGQNPTRGTFVYMLHLLKTRDVAKDEHDTGLDKPYDGTDDFAKSIDVAYEAVRERMAAGGKGWEPKR